MSTKREYSPLDFVYGPILGEGLFGSVVYAELINDGDRASSQVYVDVDNNVGTLCNNNKAYAIKMIPKSGRTFLLYLPVDKNKLKNNNRNILQI